MLTKIKIVRKLFQHFCANDNSARILLAIKNVLTEFTLNLGKIRGIGTDNASIIAGVNNSMYTKLKEKIPHLTYTVCVCVIRCNLLICNSNIRNASQEYQIFDRQNI